MLVNNHIKTWMLKYRILWAYSLCKILLIQTSHALWSNVTWAQPKNPSNQKNKDNQETKKTLLRTLEAMHVIEGISVLEDGSPWRFTLGVLLLALLLSYLAGLGGIRLLLKWGGTATSGWGPARAGVGVVGLRLLWVIVNIPVLHWVDAEVAFENHFDDSFFHPKISSNYQSNSIFPFRKVYILAQFPQF